MRRSDARAVGRRVAPWVFLTVWGAVSVAIGAVLMASHWVPLPVPARDDPTLKQGLAELSPTAGWAMVHVLYAECPCSLRTFDYLFERGAQPGLKETVVLVGEHREYTARGRAAGFRVESITPTELQARFNVESVPLLLIRDPDGEVRYAGGYTARKQGLDYQDLTVLAELRKGGAGTELPAYGCAASAELQALFDPIGVKYRPRGAL